MSLDESTLISTSCVDTIVTKTEQQAFLIRAVLLFSVSASCPHMNLVGQYLTVQPGCLCLVLFLRAIIAF